MIVYRLQISLRCGKFLLNSVAYSLFRLIPYVVGYRQLIDHIYFWRIFTTSHAIVHNKTATARYRSHNRQNARTKSSLNTYLPSDVFLHLWVRSLTKMSYCPEWRIQTRTSTAISFVHEWNAVIRKAISAAIFHWHRHRIMMTSSNGNMFRVTGPLWGDSTGHRWTPVTKANDAELWCFRWSAP